MPARTAARHALELIEQKRFKEAEAVILHTPHWADEPPLMFAMAHVRAEAGDATQAIYLARKAFAKASKFIDAAQEYLDIAWQHGTADDAGRATREIVQSPAGAQLTDGFYRWMCSKALDKTRFLAALAINNAALERYPSDINLLCGKGTVALSMGDPEGALVAAKEALARFADPPIGLHALMAAVTNYACEDPAEVFAAHRACGQAIQKLRPHAPMPPRDPDPERPLHIGLISGDFYDHAVVRFLSSFLTHRDRVRSIVTCYMTVRVGDDVTKWIQSQVNAYHHIDTINAVEQAHALIMKERVDVLIDLAGMLPGQSLEVTSMRAAPVQMTMIGFPATTGLSTMDVRVVDSLTDPAGAEAFATERLVRIDPCFLCYTPRPDAPAVEQRPPGGPVVFGSFNSMQKHTMRTLRLWARVMERAPGSRLIIKNRMVMDKDARAVLERRVTDAGIPLDRCDLVAFIKEKSGHLGAYARVDVALDTFPYHGTTTTCEALYMGVPVVSRVGATHAARVGLSLLTNVGLPDLACETDDGFVETAAALAADAPRRAALRSTLRERMLSSPLCDAAAHTRRLEDLIRAEWRRVCTLK